MFGLGWVHEGVHDPAYERLNKEQHLECDRPRRTPGAHPRRGQSRLKPEAFAVATPETMPDMNIERISGVRKAP